MATLFVTHAQYTNHLTGRGHPERPERLASVAEAARTTSVADDLVTITPRAATDAELELVHPAHFVASLSSFCDGGGGMIDGDTVAVPASLEAARLAAGAGPSAIDALRTSDATAAFCAVRPPGHHARPEQSMGFCLFNNVAVAAATLREAGERVAIVDYDAHHGNGTQDAFYDDPDVLYASIHQHPLYPGTGGLMETGEGAGRGMTVNVPVPAGATGDVYRTAVEQVIAPVIEAWSPTWLIVSAGFDAHRADPLTQLGLSSGDYADLTTDLMGLVDPGRRLVFLEGGYDLDGLMNSTSAALAALSGEIEHREAPTSGGGGRAVVDEARRLHLG